MRTLVLLIVMVLAGGAGWYVGSWSGRDAISALAKAKELGDAAQSVHDKTVNDLNRKLSGLAGEFEQGQKKLNDDHAQAKAEFNTALAQRDQRIAVLGQQRSATQTRIVTLRETVAASGVSADDKARAQDEIARLEKVVADQKTLIAGLECSKERVPAELLAPLRTGQP